MKQTLHFQSEQEFQNFVGQLFSAEFPNFQAIEGAGGDGGLDGLDGNTIYQVFFPDLKNRNHSRYKGKIDSDLPKAIKTAEKLDIDLARWILIVPEDLRFETIGYLNQKSKEKGIVCLAWGATKLNELINKHPHIRNSFPGIFLPDVRDDISDVKISIDNLSRPKTLTNVEIVTDKDFQSIKNKITEEFHQKAKGASIRFGDSSASQASSVIYQKEANTKMDELRIKKERSDKAFELEKQDIEVTYDKILQTAKEEMNSRGLSSSGIANKRYSEIEDQKIREIGKLKLKYGKDSD